MCMSKSRDPFSKMGGTGGWGWPIENSLMGVPTNNFVRVIVWTLIAQITVALNSLERLNPNPLSNSS